MAKRTKFTATFSDGTVLTRTTATRVYTHAWFAKGTRPDPGEGYTQAWRDIRVWEKCGFSSSAAQAARNMEGETAYVRRGAAAGYTTEFSEVVEVTR